MDQLSPSHPLRAGILILASLLWYQLTVAHLKTSADIQLACRGWLIGAFLTGAYGIWFWAKHEEPLFKGIESVLDDTNSYGSYLVLTLFVAWAACRTEKSPWTRSLALITVVTTTWMLLLAGSRIAIIAATACAGIAWTILAKSARGKWIRGSVLAALTGLILLSPLVWDREAIEVNLRNIPGLESWGMQRLAQAMDAQFVLKVWLQGRQAIIAAGIRMIGDRPAFGQGPGNFVSNLGDFYRPQDRGRKPPHENAHNYFIQVAAETGILGLAGFLWIIAARLVAGFTRDPNQERLRVRLLTIGVVGYLITGVTGHPLVLSEQVFLFWGSLGILAASSRLGQGTSAASSPERVTSMS
jgi:O-antigen ligase